jgi:uncharacterized protein YwqG
MDFSSLAKKAIILSPKISTNLSALASKFGGQPALDSLEEWPKQSDGAAMSFVGQINFEEVAQKYPQLKSELPTKGVLMFFLNEENMFDEDGYYKFIYKNAPKEAVGMNLPEQSLEVKEAALEGKIEDNYPKYLDQEMMEKAGIKGKDFTDEKRYAYEDKYLKSTHQLLGYPFPIQDEPIFDVLDGLKELPEFPEYRGNLSEEEKEAESKKRKEIQLERIKIANEKAKDWVMLWQIVSDDEIFSTYFGDDGIFYVMIEKEKLAKGDFSNVRLILQC